MDPVKVIIELRKGDLSAVYSNIDLQYVLVDFDHLSERQDPVTHKGVPDIVTGSLNAIYGGSATGKRIKKKLKKIKF